MSYALLIKIYVNLGVPNCKMGFVKMSDFENGWGLFSFFVPSFTSIIRPPFMNE